MTASSLLHDGITLFRNGLDGYPFYRIPSLLAINASLLLAFAEGRGQRTDHGRVDIVLKRSVDGGASWSPLSVVHSAGARGGTIGNPAPLYDDELVLFFCHENLEILSMRSSDFGTSWSIPLPISWSRPPSWEWVASGPPAALVTSSGAWVLPCDGLIGSKQLWSALEPARSPLIAHSQPTHCPLSGHSFATWLFSYRRGHLRLLLCAPLT